MNQVLSYLKTLLKDNDIIVVAISGGPDSMCLLHLLESLKLDLKIIVAHVNHKLREESLEEAEFVESFAKDNDLIYEYMEINEYNHDNLENEARVKRYDFFKCLIDKYKADYLMTAHHSDDLMETILMRLVRGSSLKGYSGFKKISSIGEALLVRPLISVTKEDIINFMNSNNYKYYIDKSNASREYTRNRYRMDVLPFLKKENKNVHLKFLKFSEELEAANTFINKYVEKIIIDIKCDKGLEIDKLLKLDEFLIKRIVEYELTNIYITDLFLISDNNTELIIDLIKGKKANGEISLPNGFKAIKDYNYFRIDKTINNEDFCYVFNGSLKIGNGIIRQIESTISKSNCVIRLNSNKISLPIKVRSRKNGDKMVVKNLNGTKKVKDIFIDEKVSIAKRNGFPVVVDAKDEILWLPGVKKSKFDEPIDGIYDIILSYEEEK